jgi:hypothetical protein
MKKYIYKYDFCRPKTGYVVDQGGWNLELLYNF